MEEPIDIPDFTSQERREQEISTRATRDPLDDLPPQSPQSLYRENKERKMLKEEVLDRITEELFKVLKENEQVEETPEKEHNCSEHESRGLSHTDWEKEQEAKQNESTEAAEEGDVVEEAEELEEEEVNENWFKGNKDQLLFERLMEKWAK